MEITDTYTNNFIVPVPSFKKMNLIYKFLISTLAVYLCLSFLSLSLIQAQTIQDISYRDLDNDGDPDLATIKTYFIDWRGKVVSNGTILVYDEDDDMAESIKWNASSDFDSDIWVFDADSDGYAELIIDFGIKDGKLAAYIYDDTTGDKKVSYNYNSTDFQITESKYWTLLVIAEDGFWTKDGKINYNLKIFGDGEVSIGQVYGEYYRGKLDPHDGTIDFNITIYDSDKDGDPDYELREYWTKKNISMLTVDYDDWEIEIKNSIFWPYLGSGHSDWDRSDWRGPPPIQIDWTNAKINNIVLSVAARRNEGNYFILTNYRIFRNQINRVDFENPFVYYDLAEDDDGTPELILRVVDEHIRHRNRIGRVTDVRYSWDQDNDGHLDYRISLLGKNVYNLSDEYVSVVEYPDFSVITVPPPKVPYWIFNRSWMAAFFIDTNGDYFLGEGVYESEFHRAPRYTVAGFDTPTKSRYIPMRIGHRGEYSLSLNNKPQLYFSPIDRELHLMNAEKGTFLISAKETGSWKGGSFTIQDWGAYNITIYESIEYENMDKDEYLDKWSYIVNDTPTKYLLYSNEFLIYSDREKTKLRKTEINLSSFKTIPPRNHEEWNKLGNKLNEYKKDIDAKDFEAMFNQFSGELITIENGFLSDFNSTDNGFMFILDCEQDCKIDSSLQINYNKPLTNGKYLFVYDGGLFIRTSTKPDLIITPSDIEFSKDEPVESEEITITVDVHHVGLSEAGPVLVQFFNGDPNSGGVEIGNYSIPLVLPGSRSLASTQWRTESGFHNISIRITSYDSISESDKTNNIAFRSIYVLQMEQPSTFERIMSGGRERTLILLSVMLFGILFLVLYVTAKQNK